MKNIRVKGPTYTKLRKLKFVLDKPITIIAQDAIDEYFAKKTADMTPKPTKKKGVKSEGTKRAQADKTGPRIVPAEADN